MFTGIVQGTCKVHKITDIENGRQLCIKLSDLASDLKQGSSVSVNGVCLTVVSLEKDFVEFDIISESLNKSNLGYLKIGEYLKTHYEGLDANRIESWRTQLRKHLDLKS